MEIIRTATFEGMADKTGLPTSEYLNLYQMLARNGVKTMITGFMYVSNHGRAMQPGQAGLDPPEKIGAYRKVTDTVHQHGSKIIAQLAHTGRQTCNTGYEILGISNKKSKYFNETPRILLTSEVYDIIEQFAASALYAKQAGFDGIQLHAAHGYLIHQFLLSSINNRKDEFSDGMLFLKKTVHKIREKCGDFPIWVKISGGVDIEKYRTEQFIELIRALDQLKVAAIEVSYGTMDNALNIFRGSIPLKKIFKYNPIYSKKGVWWRIFGLFFQQLKIKPFTPMYNLQYAQIAKAHTSIPIITVGGFRSGTEIFNCEIDYVSLCRPLICEPDFIKKLEDNKNYHSKCTNCNQCAIMTDTKYSLQCYGGNKNGTKNY